jgi:hypothetical protein
MYLGNMTRMNSDHKKSPVQVFNQTGDRALEVLLAVQ